MGNPQDPQKRKDLTTEDLKKIVGGTDTGSAWTLANVSDKPIDPCRDVQEPD